MESFLPVTYEEMCSRGIKQPDFVYVTGDAYVDHPSFGAAIVSRLIESLGFSICMLPQPDWHSTRDFMRFGKPRLAFLVTGGNIDSMVAHYTAAKRKRSDDMYSPGGKAGKRPDRAVITYCRKIREAYPDSAIAIGGLEASLRRFAHYDYWDDKVRPSVLADSGADLLMYGMGEHQITELCTRLGKGEPISSIRDIRGTCYMCDPVDTPYGAVQCPDYSQVCSDKKAYAKATRQQYDQQDEVYGKTVIQRHGSKMLVQNPPALSLAQEELDAVYRLPFTRKVHPMYEKEGGVPGIEEVQFSIAHNRGCFGYCNFCSIALHQGRRVTCRSEESVLEEARKITEMDNFKGYIHDVGGPTANFRHPSCEKQLKAGMCKGKKCLAPTPCPALKADHTEYLAMLRKLRSLPKVKRVFIRSGIRFDYLLEDKDDSFFKELVKEHVSGQLKVAPEHCSNAVLDKMGKPHIETYNRFQKRFYEITKSIGKEQYLVPYLMSSHPGSTLKEAISLALYLRDHNIHPEQVQDFYPTPGTISTCMYYTELDPYTMEPVYVPKTPKDKAMQRALLQYYLPKNRELVLEALKRAGRYDLIGTGKGCLAAPEPGNSRSEEKGDNRTWQKKNAKETPLRRKKAPARQTKDRSVQTSQKSRRKKYRKPM
ncbi:MAG: YgiQ family radical SAM protein [Oscillospiraceae bacterium]|nr:YgiQ family radical SAM protein [Oscillospiraceae bacterium]